MKKQKNKTVVQIVNEIEKKCLECKLDREWSAVALFNLLSDIRKRHE